MGVGVFLKGLRSALDRKLKAPGESLTRPSEKVGGRSKSEKMFARNLEVDLDFFLIADKSEQKINMIFESPPQSKNTKSLICLPAPP